MSGTYYVHQTDDWSVVHRVNLNNETTCVFNEMIFQSEDEGLEAVEVQEWNILDVLQGRIHGRKIVFHGHHP
jgi:hypothetical protein